MTVIAYLDPGTGSLIIQGVAAAIFGSIVVVKVYWLRLRAFFAGAKARPEVDLALPERADDAAANAEAPSLASAGDR